MIYSILQNTKKERKTILQLQDAIRKIINNYLIGAQTVLIQVDNGRKQTKANENR